MESTQSNGQIYQDNSQNEENLENFNSVITTRSKSKSKLQESRLSSLRTPLINHKFIDFSNGLERTKLLFPSKHKTKLLRSKFDYKENYIVKSYLKNWNIDEYLLTGDYCCNCEETCEKESCECIVNHAQRYECNSKCTCFENCWNRKIQKGVGKKLKIDFICKEKGFGVFAREKIKKDEFVCEYIGQIIHKDDAQIKIKTNLIKKKPNYVLQVRENYEKMTINTFIDAEENGNVSRFLNHSCDPNLYFDIIRVSHFIPQVAFFALRDIEQGEELTFSYNDSELNNNDSVKNNIEEEFQRSYKACLCGSKNCKIFLPS